MRYGIVSDIHSNLAAFEAVLEDMGTVDALWCLGDVVGYGPDPNECVELLRRHEHICVLGNHDAAAIGKLDTSDFNPVAAHAAAWTAGQLSERTRSYLLALPEAPVIREPFTIVHGSPRHPVWEYITNAGTAAANFRHFSSRACLVGHTHVPALFELRDSTQLIARRPEIGEVVAVRSLGRFIANPGSVGQPRDGDPTAAYGIYDADAGTLEWRRVEYPIATTQERMGAAGLPRPLIDRLSYGY